MKRTDAIAVLLAASALLQPQIVHAQFDQAITTQEMMEPWMRAHAIILSLTPSPSGGDRQPVIQALLSLDTALSAYQSDQEDVATRIVGDRAFSYEASKISSELASKLISVSERLEALWTTTGISDREDVENVRAALSTLQRKLSQRNPLERDVVRALGSGSKHEILALSTRWWDAVGAVDKVREAIATLHKRMDTAALHLRVYCETLERFRC